MYKLVLERAPNCDEPNHIFESDINDIAGSIAELLPDIAEDSVKINGNELVFNSSLPLRVVKELLKDVFAYHINSVRVVSLTEVKHPAL